LGWFLTICAAEIAFGLFTSYLLYSHMTTPGELPGKSADFAIIGGTVGILIGLIRAFLMTPKRLANVATGFKQEQTEATEGFSL
jgi:Na+/H+-dicarboxylate symporter